MRSLNWITNKWSAFFIESHQSRSDTADAGNTKGRSPCLNHRHSRATFKADMFKVTINLNMYDYSAIIGTFKRSYGMNTNI